MADDANSTNIDPQDLDLVDQLEDAGKEDAELWQEFDQAEAAATDHDQPPGDEPGGEGEDRDAATEDQGQDLDSEANRGVSDDASPRGQSDGEQPSDAGQSPDLWATATPEQRAAHEAAQQQLKKLEQAERSNRGRLSAMQRQLNELTTRQPQQAVSTEAAQGQQDGGDTDGILASQDWKAFQEEYPEVAGPLGKFIGNLQSEVTRQSKELSAIGSDRRQTALDEQATLLAEEHPDWTDVTADQGFGEWLQQQPRHIKEAAARNGNEIVDWEEASDVVGRFKQFRAQQQGGGNAQQQNQPQANGGQGSTNNRLAGKRQRQLESASTARSRGPGAASGIPEDGDPEAIWRQFDEMERRQAR